MVSPEKAAIQGETMSVVLEIQMKELKKQMEDLRQERDSLLQQVSSWNGCGGKYRADAV